MSPGGGSSRNERRLVACSHCGHERPVGFAFFGVNAKDSPLRCPKCLRWFHVAQPPRTPAVEQQRIPLPAKMGAKRAARS